MAFAHLASILALRRVSQRHALSDLLTEQRDATADAMQQATRHAWLALEIAVSGPTLWQRISDSLSSAEGNVFRQQQEALLDLLNLAGLRGENPESLGRCRAELKAARLANLFLADLAEALQAHDAALLHEPMAADAERSWIEQLARGFEQAGYPHLARLATLRSSWDQTLLVGIFEYFLQRALLSRIGAAAAPELAADSSGLSWRSLEMSARLLRDCDEALIALLDHVEEAPAAPAPRRRDDEVDKLLQQGLNALRSGQYQNAATHFTAALKIDSGNPVLYFNRAEAYRLQCEYERAIADFDLALLLNPADCAALVNRATAHQFSGDQARAVADCSAALLRNPKNPAAYCIRAAAFLAQGEPDRALADLTEAIAQAPTDEGIRYQRAQLYVGKRMFAQAVADFDRVVELNPNHVLALLHRGQTHLCRSQYAQAIADFSEVLRHHPNNALACVGRGQAFHLYGDVERAIADYTTALRLEPDNAQTYCRRGILYRSKGDLARALADLDEAIRREPENATALYQRGRIALAQARFALAVADFDDALHLQPKLAVAQLSRALAHDRLGQYQEGLADTAEALKLHPRAAAARLLRGILLAHTGEYTAAIEQLNQAIELDANFAIAYQERSAAYLLQRDYAAALADCDQLLALEPANAHAYASRSVIFYLTGKVQQSLTDYAQALRIDPKCVLTAANPRLAENVRSQATQRIADYVDGQRTEPAAVPQPPRVNFRIVVERPGSKNTQVTPATETKRSVNETMTMAKDETTIAAEAAPTTIQRVKRKRRPVTVTKPAVHETSVAEDAAPEPAEAESSTAAEDDACDLTISPAESVHTVSEVAETEQENAAATEYTPAPEEPAGIDCPLCYAKGAGTALSGGRVHCGSCDKIFYSSTAAATPSTITKPETPAAPTPAKSRAKKAAKKKTADDDDDAKLIDHLKKPAPLAIGAIAAVVALYFFFPMSMFGSDRTRVYAARGEATYAGKPMPNAAILLHPAGDKEPTFPRPKATVKDDGSFVLGTYGKDDGAPAGEYTVTVQWFPKQEGRILEDAPPPSNLLPARFANPKTSRLTVQIKEGENRLPALNLNP